MNSRDLTQGSVFRTMLRLSVPMMGGIFSAIAFNLADTYFVSLLGSDELAAMSFTFPVVMVMFGLTWGLSTGITSVVSRAVGRGEGDVAIRLTSDGLMLGFLTVLVVASLGIVTISPLFRFLGATDDLLPLIHEYMDVWYAGMVFLVVPMMANAAIRARGDTKTPALIIIAATVSNVILDPILIFGWMGVPAMGLRGAAIATIICRFGTFVAVLLVLRYREHLLDFSTPKLSQVWASWKAISVVAIPATVTNVFAPAGGAVVTRLIAEYGPSAVAAWGAGSRISMFVLIPIFGYCSALVPFVGQNWGAERLDRVRTGRNLGYGFAFVWGAVSVALLYLFREPIAGIFAAEEEVGLELARYLSIVPIGYAMFGILNVTEETLNAIGRSLLASTQTLAHTFAFGIPLALYGSHVAGVTGLLVGLTIADWGGGLLGIGLSLWSCRTCFIARQPVQPSAA